MMLTRPATAAVYRVEDMGDDAISVLDALESDSAHIVGVSLGGMIARPSQSVTPPGSTR
jgi:pimeloyl-ACP methyl ester carboxylesterase